ncbi:MAG: carbohydrate-binding protein [Bacteroidetes bacterium]|nr:carbohydrate-binding protein [Bacteroidota bacterium]
MPSITYEFPTNIQVGGNATFTGTSSDPDGRVQRVEFYQGDGLVDRIVRGVEQWTVTVDNLSEGCYNVRAKVIDDGGWTFDSPVTPFNVGATCGQAPYLMSPHPIERRIEAEYFDLGGPRVAYRDLSSTNDGNGIRLDEGVDIYPTTDGTGYHIGNTSRREWVNYTVHVDRAGIYDVQVRMASQARSVSFSLEFDGVDKTGLIEHPTPTNTFRTARINLDDGIQLDEGTQVMKLTIGGGVPSINWFQFRLRSPTNREETPDTGETALMGNYPNPFTSSTIIDYYIATSGHFELDLFNTLGQHVRTLANHHHQAGNYTATVYAQGLSPGTYVYRLSGRVTTHGILQYVRE